MKAAFPRVRRAAWLLLRFLLLVGVGLALPPAARAGSVTASPEPSVVQQLQLLFEANYRPAADLLHAAFHVATLGRQLELNALPRFTFTERVTWQGSQNLSLDVDLATTFTLYRSNATRLAALQALRTRLLEWDTAFARRDARHRFHGRLLGLSLYRWLDQQLAASLALADTAPWRRPQDLAAALSLYPEERDPVALGRSLQGLRDQITQRITDLERELVDQLGTPGPVPALPPLEELVAHLAPTVTTAAMCLSTSPLLAQTDLQHRLQSLEREVKAMPDVRLELFGSGRYQAGGLGGDLSGLVGVELRVPLPSAGPLDGQLSVTADPSQLEQTLSLSWPPAAPHSRPVGELEHARRLADERATLGAEIEELFRSLASAEESVRSAELQLLWLVADIYGAQPGGPHAGEGLDLATVRSLSLVPAPEPFADLQRVRYLSELALARLAHAEQLLAVGLVCEPNP